MIHGGSIMSIHTAQVFEYLDTHPVSRYEGDFQSLLEMLHYIYTTCNPIDNDRIHESFLQLGEILSVLSFDEQNALSAIVCDLCYEHEQSAFFHGLSVGMHLMTEVNCLP